MQAKSEPLEIPREQLETLFRSELRQLRPGGMYEPDVSGFLRLRALAALLTPGGTPNEELEALLELAIERCWPKGSRDYDVIRLSFGLDTKTRQASSAERHKAAYERYGKGELTSFTSHQMGKMYVALTLQLSQLYDERDTLVVEPGSQQPTQPENPPARAAPPTTPSASQHSTVEAKPLARSKHVKAFVFACIIVAAALALVLSRSLGLLQASPPVSPLSNRRLTSQANHLLRLAETPVPGETSRRLGFGDAIGGRTVYPYERRSTATTSAPTFDSLVDVPHGVGDERKFLHVAIVRRKNIHLVRTGARSATLPANKVASIRVYVENSAGVPHPCDRPSPTTASGAQLRLAIWNSPDARLHIIRAWLVARNTKPRWVTDAVAILTDTPAKLILDKRASKYWLQDTKSDYPFPAARVLQPGGVPIGVGGLLGSCWKYREVYNFVFTQHRVPRD